VNCAKTTSIVIARKEVFALAVLCAWMTLEYFILGKYSYISVGTNDWGVMTDANMALRFTSPSRPYWFPYGGGGLDLLSMGSILEIPRWLFQLLPGWLAYQIFRIAPFCALAAATYLLARQRLELSPPAALFAAFVNLVLVQGSDFIFVPIALVLTLVWALFRLFDNVRSAASWLILLLVAAVFSFSSILAYIVIFPAVFAALATLFFYRPLRLAQFLIIVCVFVFIYLLKLDTLLATLANVSLSVRQFWSNPQLTDFYAPSGLDLFTHAIRGDGFRGLFTLQPSFVKLALVLTLSAWFVLPGSKRMLARVCGVILSAIFLGIAIPVAKGLLLDVLPQLKSFGADRMWWYGVLFTGFGAAFLVEALDRRWHATGGWTRARLAVVFAPLVLYSGYMKLEKAPYIWISQGNYVRNIESPVLSALAKRIGDERLPWRALTYQLYENNLNSYGIETVGGWFQIVPERYKRFFVKLAEPSFGTDPREDYNIRDYGLYLSLGMNYEANRTVSKLALASKARLNLLSLAGGRYVVSRTELTDLDLVDLRLGQPERSWSDLTPREKAWINLRENFTGRNNLYVYENPRALSRFRFVSSLIVLDDVARVLEETANAPIETLDSTLFLDGTSAEALQMEGSRTGFASGNIRLVHYSADRIRLEIEDMPEGDALLVVSNSYSPYWKCLVDGVETKIVPAYATFWAVRLPKGAKEVEFLYDPFYAVLR
jgi:hypothetical protein